MNQKKQFIGLLAAVGLAVLMLVFTGCGGGSDTIFAEPPAKPTNLTVTSGSTQASVSWAAVRGATSYNIYYGTTAGVTSATGTKRANAAAPQVISGLIDGTPYYFVVTAVNTTG